MSSGRAFLRALCASAVAVAAMSAVPAASATEPAPALGSVGPLLASFAADPPVVDVSAAPAVIAVSVRLSDADGVTSAAVRLGADERTPLALSSGTPKDGTWTGVVGVAAFTAHGTVDAHVDAADSLGALATPEVDAAVRIVDAAPGAPAGIAARTDSAGAVRVEWSPPPANGGSPVVTYDVVAAPAPGSDPAAVEPPATSVDAAARSVTIRALSDATRYVVRVTARNAVGAGPAATADATTSVGSITVADAPTAVTAVPEDRGLRLSWTPPASDGGSFVDAYEVRATPWTSSAPVPPPVIVHTESAVVPGLVNGMPYDVAVTAVNGAGASLPARVAATPRTVAGTPVLGAVTPSDTTAVVRWDAPASDGGSAVQAYDIAVSPHNYTLSVPGSARSVTVAGLPNGVPVTFTVAAVNAAGTGVPTPPTPPAVPRQAGRLSVVTSPPGSVLHGTPVSVGAALTTAGDVGIPGQRVELHAQVKPSTAWTRVAYGTTGSDGRITLSVSLSATAALRLHHPAGIVAAADVGVRTVSVIPRLTAVASSTRIRIGQSVVVRGAISPVHPTGTTVYLQRFYSGMWRNVASGRMNTSTSYSVSWKPPATGGYALRVALPAHADHALGASKQWWQAVVKESAAEIARAIWANRRITLETTHDSGIRDLAHARQNIYDVMYGRLARRSSYQNAPGGYTALDVRLLRALRRMGEVGSVTVSEIAGGSHARGSTHYYGRGLDISWVNGRHVARGSGYQLAVDACRAAGASRIYHPGYDPVGGHQLHVHCDWA